MSNITDDKFRDFFRKHLGWIVTGFLTLLFWMQTCNFQQKIREGKETIKTLELDKQTLTKKVNDQGQTIWSQQSIITESKESLNQLTDTIFQLKRKNAETIAYFKTITKTSIKEVQVPFLDSARMLAFEDSVARICPIISDFIRDSTIVVPATASLSSPHFQINATVRKEGIELNNLSLPDTLQLRFLEKRGSLFRRPKVEVQFFHSNPYVTSQSANSVFYRPKRASFFKRVVLPVAVGVGAGLIISR